jgi:hypothetical protein
MGDLDLAADYVVVGGGIAGISCAEMLATESTNASVLVITPSSAVKITSSFSRVTARLTTFDVEEVAADEYVKGGLAPDGVRLLREVVREVIPADKVILTRCRSVTQSPSGRRSLFSLTITICRSGRRVGYKRSCCLCQGAEPKVIPGAADQPHVLAIRDTESVKLFQERLAEASRVVIVGNGGIGKTYVSIYMLCAWSTSSSLLTVASNASLLLLQLPSWPTNCGMWT